MYIKQFLDSLGYDHPRSYSPSSKKKMEFKQKSYSVHFVQELEEYIYKNRDHPVDQTILEFRNMMEDYSCKSQNPQVKWMFSVGYDVASYALEMIQNGSSIV